MWLNFTKMAQKNGTKTHSFLFLIIGVLEQVLWGVGLGKDGIRNRNQGQITEIFNMLVKLFWGYSLVIIICD